MGLSRERMEEIIKGGGSVLVSVGGKQRLVAILERLPSHAELARTEKEKLAAADSIDQTIAALQAQKDGLNLNQSVSEPDLSNPNPQKGETGSEFTPLSREETMERFTKGDSSDIVFQSMKHHQSSFAEDRAKDEADREEWLKKAAEEAGKGKSEGLPEDFPMRHVFEGLGFNSVEAIQGKSRDELIALNGIGEKSADAVLAYGK